MSFDPNLINKKYYNLKTRNFYIIIGYDKDVDRYISRVIHDWLNYYSGIVNTEIESFIFSIEQFDKYLDKYYNDNKVLIEAYRKSEKSRIVRKSITAIIECNKMINTLKGEINVDQREIQKTQKGIRRKCKVLHRMMTQNEINELLDVLKNDHICYISALGSAASKYNNLLKARDKAAEEFLLEKTGNKIPQIINKENTNEKKLKEILRYIQNNKQDPKDNEFQHGFNLCAEYIEKLIKQAD